MAANHDEINTLTSEGDVYANFSELNPVVATENAADIAIQNNNTKKSRTRGSRSIKHTGDKFSEGVGVKTGKGQSPVSSDVIVDNEYSNLVPLSSVAATHTERTPEDVVDSWDDEATSVGIKQRPRTMIETVQRLTPAKNGFQQSVGAVENVTIAPSGGESPSHSDYVSPSPEPDATALRIESPSAEVGVRITGAANVEVSSDRNDRCDASSIQTPVPDAGQAATRRPLPAPRRTVTTCDSSPGLARDEDSSMTTSDQSHHSGRSEGAVVRARPEYIAPFAKPPRSRPAKRAMPHANADSHQKPETKPATDDVTRDVRSCHEEETVSDNPPKVHNEVGVNVALSTPAAVKPPILKPKPIIALKTSNIKINTKTGKR